MVILKSYETYYKHTSCTSGNNKTFRTKDSSLTTTKVHYFKVIQQIITVIYFNLIIDIFLITSIHARTLN
jgi:hypothetical protein